MKRFYSICYMIGLTGDVVGMLFALYTTSCSDRFRSLFAMILTPFTVVPGLAAEDGSIYGTWYLATDTQGGDFQPLCAAQKGTVSVKKTGDTYTIDFDITDDDFKISVKGSYTGKPYIHDGTANTTSVSTRAAAASGKALNIHKSARRQAFRK